MHRRLVPTLVLTVVLLMGTSLTARIRTASTMAATPPAVASPSPPIPIAQLSPASVESLATRVSGIETTVAGLGGRTPATTRALDLTAWSIPDGWTVDGGLRTTGDGTDGGWLTPPASGGLGPNHAVEMTFRVEGGGECPRNFGVAVRGSDVGYYAAGIEWGCDPELTLWAGQEVLDAEPVALGDGAHTLRLGAVGDAIQVELDGRVVLAAVDDRNPTGQEIAIWSSGTNVLISTVAVVDLGADPGAGTPIGAER